MANQETSNRQLRDLLLQLGFSSRTSVEPKCLVFEHSASQARILLPSNKDDDPARAADVLSIRTHLLRRGLLDDEAFEHYVEHGVLRAS